MQKIQLTDILHRNNAIMSSQVDGELIMVSLEQGQYYGLDAVGSRIWELLETARPLNEVVENLLAEYEVDQETCETQVIDLVEKLLQKGLLRLTGG